MYQRLHHVDWAVKDAEASAQHFARAFGLRATHFYTALEEGLRSAFIPLAQCPLELMDATDETGPVARFLKARGEGIYLVALGVEDLAVARSNLQARGARLVPGRASGAGYFFVHPQGAHGVLIEMSTGIFTRPEPPKPLQGREGTIRKVSTVLVAVRDLDQAVATYTQKLGFPQPQLSSQPPAGVRNAVFSLGADHYEILQPITTESPVHRFLERRGEGVYAVSLEAGDLAAEVKAMKAQGVRFMEQEMQMGGRTRKMVFVPPTSACGAMLSLSQGD